MNPHIMHLGYKEHTSDPMSVPSLYQQSVKAFVKQLNHLPNHEVKILELQVLPMVALKSVLKEMSCYPSLREKLHQELSNPVVFMRMFMGCESDRLVLQHCLREASSIGKSVLPEVARNWCKMVCENKSKTDSSVIKNKITEAIELGTYLHEAGWASQSKEVLDIALQMFSQLTEDQHNKTLKIICMQKLLRAEVCAVMLSEADTTCSALLTMIEGITDNAILISVFLEVAHHHRRAERFADFNSWTRKAMELMTESTSTELVLRFLQLEAVNLTLLKRYEPAGMLINQAILRARNQYGEFHRQYAGAIYTHGLYLLKINAFSYAIPILLELLDLISKLYGSYTPHIVIIRSFLAYAYYRRSQPSGQLYIAYSHIQIAIAQAKQIMPERQEVINHFCKFSEMIRKGHERGLTAARENSAIRVNDSKVLDVEEIKQKCFELHDDLDV